MSHRHSSSMTTLTLRYIRDHFVVTGPDIEPMRFKSRPEARDWCRAHYPRVPIIEIGRDRSRRMVEGSMGRPPPVRLCVRQPPK